MTRTRGSRFAWLLAAILQLLVPTVWSVADAQAEAASARTATVHVEAQGSKSCPRVHPADCAVCRVIATNSLASRPAPVAIPALPVIRTRAVDAARHAPSARAPGDPPQRAPPALS